MENISDQKQIEHNTEAPNSTTAEEKESQEIVQEGTENNISEEITDAPPKKTLKKKLAFILILVALVCIGSIWYIGYYKGEFYTTEEKLDKIFYEVICGNYSKGIDLTRRFFGYTDDSQELVDAILDYQYDSIASDILGDENQANKYDITSKVNVTDKQLVRDGDYYYFTGTIENNSDQTLSYVKVDIFLYDDLENLIGSEWTNWSGTLPPNGSTTIDTMIRAIEGYSSIKYSVAVDEVSVK